MKQLVDTRLKHTLLAATVLACVPGLHAAMAATISGNVAGFTTSAPKTGVAPDSRTVDIAVHMRLKDQAGLQRLAADVSRPKSAMYGHYLTNSAFAARFAPDTADVAAVKAMLAAGNMTNIKVGPMGAYVSATATVGQLRETFKVSQDLYTVGGRTLRANKEAPSVPAALADKIVFIEGIDDTTYLKQPNHKTLDAGPLRAPVRSAGATPAVTPPPVAANAPSPYCSTYFGTLRATLSTKPNPYGSTVPWLGCGYTPQQIQAAYGLDKVSQTGTGMTVAFTDAYASPTLKSDGNRYAANHSLPPLTSENFAAEFPTSVLNANPSDSCVPYGWWGEQSLDLAAVHGTAPGAKILYVGSKDCGVSLSLALVDLIYANTANIISNSWGYNQPSFPSAQAVTFHQAFVAAAVQGETVLFSSGDFGDLALTNGIATGSGPGDDDYVTSVGGTSLLIRSADGTKSEYGWGNYRDYLGDALINSVSSITTTGPMTTTVDGTTYDAYSFYSGSGGGVSPYNAQPDYQVGVVPTSLATTLLGADGSSATIKPVRVTPDISMVGDPYTGYLYGQTMTIAGDSYSDAGCSPISATTEYCEEDIGGTSLASPLLAGVFAIWNEARVSGGKPLVGFVNPALYAMKIGPGLSNQAVNDVKAPTAATSVLRGYQNDLTRIRLVTINSVPKLAITSPYPLQVCAKSICEGIDGLFNSTTEGYDAVTGLGVPYAPQLILQ